MSTAGQVEETIEARMENLQNRLTCWQQIPGECRQRWFY